MIRFDGIMNRTPTQGAFQATPDPGGWNWAWIKDGAVKTKRTSTWRMKR
jgi:hypothetical protein